MRANRLILVGYERPLQPNLVRFDRTVPVAGCVGSGNHCASASAQRAASQVPEAVDQIHRSPDICWAVSAGPRRIGRPEILKPETVIRFGVNENELTVGSGRGLSPSKAVPVLRKCSTMSIMTSRPCSGSRWPILPAPISPPPHCGPSGPRP